MQSGLLVVAIDAGGPSDRLGIKLKDVLFQVGRFYVTDLKSLGMILEDFTPGDSTKIGIVRGRVRAWATLRSRKPAGEKPKQQAPGKSTSLDKMKESR